MNETPTPSLHRRFVAAAIFLFIVIAGSFAYQHFTSIYHFAIVQPGVLYRDGARSAHELERAVSRVNAKTVVCLVDDNEFNDPNKPQFKEEWDWLQQHNIHRERIPVTLGGYPTTQDIQKFLTVVEDPKNQPVLVHCAQGVRRTAMMVAAYQRSVMNLDKDQAKAAILTFGHSEKTIDEIRRFIDMYDSKARAVSIPAQATRP